MTYGGYTYKRDGNTITKANADDPSTPLNTIEGDSTFNLLGEWTSVFPIETKNHSETTYFLADGSETENEDEAAAKLEVGSGSKTLVVRNAVTGGVDTTGDTVAVNDAGTDTVYTLADGVKVTANNNSASFTTTSGTVSDVTGTLTVTAGTLSTTDGDSSAKYRLTNDTSVFFTGTNGSAITVNDVTFSTTDTDGITISSPQENTLAITNLNGSITTSTGVEILNINNNNYNDVSKDVTIASDVTVTLGVDASATIGDLGTITNNGNAPVVVSSTNIITLTNNISFTTTDTAGYTVKYTSNADGTQIRVEQTKGDVTIARKYTANAGAATVHLLGNAGAFDPTSEGIDTGYELSGVTSFKKTAATGSILISEITERQYFDVEGTDITEESNASSAAAVVVNGAASPKTVNIAKSVSADIDLTGAEARVTGRVRAASFELNGASFAINAEFSVANNAIALNKADSIITMTDGTVYRLKNTGGGVTVNPTTGLVSGLTDGDKVTISTAGGMVTYELKNGILVVTDTDGKTASYKQEDSKTEMTAVFDSTKTGVDNRIIVTGYSKDAEDTASTSATGFETGNVGTTGSVTNIVNEMMVDRNGQATTDTSKAIATLAIQNGDEIKYEKTTDSAIEVKVGETAPTAYTWDIRTGNGADVVSVNSKSNTNVDAGEGKNTIAVNSTGSAVVESRGGNNTVAITTSGDVTFASGSGNDRVTASGTGEYTITESGGKNLIDHSAGTDGKATIRGGSGKDTIKVAGLNDVVNGGSGEDTFDATTTDISISDYNYAEDVILGTTTTGKLTITASNFKAEGTLITTSGKTVDVTAGTGPAASSRSPSRMLPARTNRLSHGQEQTAPASTSAANEEILFSSAPPTRIRQTSSMEAMATTPSTQVKETPSMEAVPEATISIWIPLPQGKWLA